MYILVLVTIPTEVQAKKLAAFLLSQKLAACVNIIPKIESFFWWQKKIDKAKESLLVIKTQKKLFDKLAKTIKANHPYDVPEIIALPIILGNKDYLNWIDVHINEMLKIEGFIRAFLFHREREPNDEKDKLLLTVHYFIKTKELFQKYVDGKGKIMQKEAETKFAGKYTASRRILKNSKSFFINASAS